jgi:SpoVK/Ycf46/Vps4 family AAA+-type ATPase
MADLGNPGTGNTTVARIVARMFAETGLTAKNLLVETDRGGLVGLYIGHTADKTARKIESAMGGVLFIDEAYSLFGGSSNDFGHEAVATLVKAMEDKRDEFVCILAGYTKEMNMMLNMNPGLRDRIQFYVDFPDYGVPELMEIFKKLCKENKYRLSESAESALGAGFKRLVSAKTNNFSNGRLVRKIFERVRMKQAFRASNNLIIDADVDAVLAEKEIAALSGEASHENIGFRA